MPLVKGLAQAARPPVAADTMPATTGPSGMTTGIAPANQTGGPWNTVASQGDLADAAGRKPRQEAPR